MKKIILSVIISLFPCMLPDVVCADGQSTVGVINTSVAHNVVWESKLYRQIEFLSDSLCSGRATGTAGSTETAFYLIRRFRRSGLIPFDGKWTSHFYEPFGRNVMGFLPGASNGRNSSYVIVMAHYDGLGTLDGTLYPGADSNASGVVAMLGIVDMFSTMRLMGQAYPHNFIFVALDAKSSSMKGARALWNEISEGRLKDPSNGHTISPDDIALAVNIDQIGGTLSTLLSGRKDYMIMLGRESVGEDNRDLLSLCNLESGIGLELAYDYYGSKDFTNIFYRKVCDQKVFVEQGIPSVLFTSGITMNNNKPYDDVKSVDMRILKLRTWLIFHFIERFS